MPSPLNQLAAAYEQQPEPAPKPDPSPTCAMCNAMVNKEDPEAVKAFMANNPFAAH